MSFERRLMRPCHVTIDSTAMAQNYELVRSRCPNVEIMAVIKADAYGHGMETAVKALTRADAFAVSGLDDVRRIRDCGAAQRVTILSEVLCQSNLEFIGRLDSGLGAISYTVFDHLQLETLAVAKPEVPLFVWLKVDTGMGRLGFTTSEAAYVYDQLQSYRSVAEVGLMSHLANADRAYRKANQIQLHLFEQLVERLGLSKQSLLNSGGICNWPDHSYEAVRPGLMLYGVSPLETHSASDLGLKPAMVFKSELISVKSVSAGQHIGYGGIDRFECDGKVGIVACGYGDGYPRHARSGTPVLVNGRRVALLGRVSMDMIAVDLSELDAKVGDPVTLWGEGLAVEEVADCADTIAYELLTGITSRVERLLI